MGSGSQKPDVGPTSWPEVRLREFSKTRRDTSNSFIICQRQFIWLAVGTRQQIAKFTLDDLANKNPTDTQRRICIQYFGMVLALNFGPIIVDFKFLTVTLIHLGV